MHDFLDNLINEHRGFVEQYIQEAEEVIISPAFQAKQGPKRLGLSV
jgi:hypothetical protein